jgi:hypothetical protein
VPFFQSVDVRFPILIAALCIAAACHRNSEFEETVAAKPMEGGAGVSQGDCVEARKRAVAKPDLEVDRLPTPIRQRPAAFQKMPTSVRSQVDKKGAVIKVDVIVDTLGRADMKTFKVVEVSNAWFADNLKTVISSWRFSPAQLAGCKVRRVYKFSATAKPRA